MSLSSQQRHEIGLIGAGEVVSRFYLPVLQSRSDIRIRAVCSGDGRRAAEIARLLGTTVVADYRSLLDDDAIESVFVCTPPHLHFEIASHAFDRGKNVLIEKPPCRNYDELLSLQAIAAQRGCVFDVTFNNAAREDNTWLAEAVLQGRIGTIELIDLEWLRAKPRPDKAWAKNPQTAGGGGVLADLGSHLLRIGVSLVPQAQRCVAYCRTTRHASSQVPIEDIACASIVIDDAVQVVLKTGWGMPMTMPVRVSIVAYGTTGTLSSRDYPGSSSDGYSNVLDRFMTAARHRRQSDLTPVNKAMQLMHALYESSRRRAPVAVDLAEASQQR
ncbi:MAG: Gfo/Idh/MocA family oxidoreductase [Xanthobacteraceae bacterium]